MSDQKKIILGFDPGLADTGWGVISKELGQIKYINCGSIQTGKNIEFATRLESIHQASVAIIKKYKPDIISIEKLYFARNVTTALDVGQARGVVMLAAKENGRICLEFTPLQVKQAITSSGSASKRQVGLMVKTLLKLAAVPKPDDAADALAIAICASFHNSKLA